MQLCRNRDLIDDFSENRFCFNTRAPARAEQDEAVLENRMRQPLDVIRQNETALLNHCQRLGGSKERGSPTWADSEFDFRMLSRPIYDLDHVIDDGIVDVNFVALLLKRQNLLRGQDRSRNAVAIAIGKSL